MSDLYGRTSSVLVILAVGASYVIVAVWALVFALLGVPIVLDSIASPNLHLMSSEALGTAHTWVANIAGTLWEGVGYIWGVIGAVLIGALLMDVTTR